jgi:hypothetical protein
VQIQNGKFKIEKEENPMKEKKCLRTLCVLRRKVVGYGRRGVLARKVVGYGRLGVLRRKLMGYGRWSAILIIALARLAWASGAAADTCKAIHVFTGTAGGVSPLGNLTRDAAGNLYSTTPGGGAYGHGVVFKLKPNPDGTWAESTLHFFFGPDGLYPNGGLIFDAAGSLYGTTYFGGDLSSKLCYPGCGVVFGLSPTSSGWSETVLHAFRGFGRNPLAPVIFDPAGNLYGTTSSGTNNNGLVFKLTP